ncbi:MAG: hypothetical protein BWX50_01368 [Euryarchaeota archaeon ADurb.Bin009]|nr:MAG: hypothetical protein BWX50_01368 [Euryarchaeota archaeon ADurb.Bin009]
MVAVASSSERPRAMRYSISWRAILPTAASWESSVPVSVPSISGMAWMMPSFRISPLHSMWPRVPSFSPRMCPREMTLPPVVIARVTSSALVCSASRMAREPRSRIEPGVATTMLENRATAFFPTRRAVGYMSTWLTGCMQT